MIFYSAILVLVIIYLIRKFSRPDPKPNEKDLKLYLNKKHKKEIKKLQEERDMLIGLAKNPKNIMRYKDHNMSYRVQRLAITLNPFNYKFITDKDLKIQALEELHHY